MNLIQLWVKKYWRDALLALVAIVLCGKIAYDVIVENNNEAALNAIGDLYVMLANDDSESGNVNG